MSPLLGCQDGVQTYPTTGKVQFPDGTPMPGGMIEFQSLQHGLNAKGEISPDGTFAMTTFVEGDGSVAGEHQIMIAPPTRPGADGGPRLQNTIHPKFLSFRTSELAVTVSDSEKNNFTLQVHR